MHNIWTAALQLLYPARCAACDAPLFKNEKDLCATCRAAATLEICFFPGGFAPFAYRGWVQRAIRRMKYSARPELAGFFARAILAAGRERIGQWHCEAVVPVPIHRRRLAKRGYNQAEQVAAVLARALGIPLRADLLYRCRHTRPQSDIGRSAREENVRGAFAAVRGKAVPARVLLVDDIYTSGATAREAIRALREAGVREIHVACAAAAIRPDEKLV